MIDENDVRRGSFCHSMDVGIACYFNDAEVALVYNQIFHWIKYNKTKKKNFINGRTWTYQTIAEIAENMPYLTEKKVKISLQKLIEEKFLIREYLSDNAFNKTSWYALPEEEMLDFQKFFTKGPKRALREAQNGPFQSDVSGPSIIDTNRETYREQQQQPNPVVVVSSDKSEEAIKQIINPIVFDSGVLKQISLLPLDQVREAHAAYLQYAESHDLDNPAGFLRKAIVEAWKPKESKTKHSEDQKKENIQEIIAANKSIAEKFLAEYKSKFTSSFSFKVTDCVWFMTKKGSSPFALNEPEFEKTMLRIIKSNIKN